jgi:hypothetical protein
VALPHVPLRSQLDGVDGLVDPGRPVGRAIPLQMYRQFVLSYPKVPSTVSRSPNQLHSSTIRAVVVLVAAVAMDGPLRFHRVPKYALSQMHYLGSPIMEQQLGKGQKNGVLVPQVLLVPPAIDWIDVSTQKKLARTGRSRQRGVRPL